MRSLTVLRSTVSHPRAPAPKIKRFRAKFADAGGPVSYAEYEGEGPTLVLVHGLGGCHLNWMPSAAMLARNARVIAVDLVGFGATPEAGRGHGMESQASMLTQFLREVVREPVTLVGNSMGGLVALMTAARAQEHVRDLILVSPALPPPRGIAEAIEPSMLARQLVHLVPGLGELAMWVSGKRGGARGLFLDLLTLGTKDVRRVPPEVVEANVSQVAQRMDAQPLGYAASYLEATRSMLAHLARPSLVDELAHAVRAPMLILHGRDDRLVPHSFSEAFVARHPRFELELLDDVGHVPQMEDAARFVQRVETWLDRDRVESAPPSRAA